VTKWTLLGGAGQRLHRLAYSVAGIVILAGALTFGYTPRAIADGGFNGAQKSEIEGIIKDYLLKNPEILIQMDQILKQKQEAEQAAAMSKAVGENSQTLFKDASTPVAGDVAGDVTVVEFFDYNCHFCRQAIGDVSKLLDQDKKIRFVFKDFPIFGKDSEGAARVAIAAKNQSKYWELHKALLTHNGTNSEAGALEIAQKLGLDMGKLKADMAKPEVQAEIDANHALADKLGINGTPHFIVGQNVIPGAPDDLYDEMSKLVADVRKNGCKVC
jgi:protein-disulfide isomerase